LHFQKYRVPLMPFQIATPCWSRRQKMADSGHALC
jgi:hypothetical protein